MATTPQDTSPQSPAPVLGETRARQGRFGRHVFWVLVVSTVLAAIGLFGAWGFKAGDLASTTPTSKITPAQAQTFDAPEPATASDAKAP